MGPRALDAIPRAGIGHWPTPLERCDRLRAALGGPERCPELWVKREDCSGLAMGGNKARKLDFLLGTALADGVEVVVTFGAWQSNHARQTAAACARLGLECELVLTPTVGRTDTLYRESGNRLLDDLLGASVHEAVDAAHALELAAKLAEGRNALVIPPGGSSPLGALGYVAATVEWAEQARAERALMHHVVCAVSTGGTYAGILAGLKRVGLPTRVLGVCVHADEPTTRATIPPLLRGVAEELGMGAVADERIELTDEFIGPGYGMPTPEMVQALTLFARTEGLVLDPVYSGKAAAALVALVRRGELRSDERVLFIHTGGAPGLFAYGGDVVPTA